MYFDSSNFISMLFIILLAWLIFMMLFRQIRLWYWKVNEGINEQRKTNALLKGIYDMLAQQNGQAPATQNDSSSSQSQQINNAAPVAQTNSVDDNGIPEL